MLTATGMKTRRGLQEVCGIFGIDLRQRVIRLSNNAVYGSRASGSADSAAGDGACLKDAGTGSQQQPESRGVCPQDRELHRIADALQAVQKRNFTTWQLQAEIHHRGRYCHPYCMDITVTRNSPTGQAMTTDAEAAVSEALRDRPSGCTVNWKTSTTG